MSMRLEYVLSDATNAVFLTTRQTTDSNANAQHLLVVQIVSNLFVGAIGILLRRAVTKRKAKVMRAL